MPFSLGKGKAGKGYYDVWFFGGVLGRAQGRLQRRPQPFTTGETRGKGKVCRVCFSLGFRDFCYLGDGSLVDGETLEEC